jgi:transposase
MDERFSWKENQNVKRRKHSLEFKKEAVRYLVLEGESAGSVSERLGINPNLLYRWKGQFLEERKGGPPENGRMSPREMAAEIDQLRQQLRRSERINEILKKTVSYFARDEQ